MRGDAKILLNFRAVAARYLLGVATKEPAFGGLAQISVRESAALEAEVENLFL
jgi:hypothetical protein